MSKRVFAAMLLLSVFAAFAESKRKDTSNYTIGPSIQPLVIIGEGWTQQFVIVNVSYYDPEPTVGTLSFYTKDGQPWRIPLRGRGSVDHVDLSIRPGQMIMLETEVSFSAQTLGWANFKLSSNTNEWGTYRAYTVFCKETTGQPDLMTSVAFADGLEDEWIIPFDNEGGKYPGIAIVNSSTSTTAFFFEVYDLNGSSIQTFTKTVGAKGLNWFSLLADHPDLAGRRGQIKVSGGFFNSAVFTLQFAGNGAFTALPIVHTYGMR